MLHCQKPGIVLAGSGKTMTQEREKERHRGVKVEELKDIEKI